MSAQRRSGIALAAAIYAVAIASVIVTGVLFTIVRSRRATDGGMRDRQLVAAAEEALFGALERWDGAARARQAVGATSAWRVDLPGAPLLADSVHVTRLDETVYWIVADAAFAGDPRLRITAPSRRRLSLLVRVPPVRLPLSAALVAAGDVALGVDARIDANAGDATCGGADSAAVLPGGAQLLLDPLYPPGAPSVRHDSLAADPRTYDMLGGESWQALADRADVQLPPDARVTPLPTLGDGACASAVNNWGDPRRVTPPGPCESRAPLVHAAGDLTIDGGSGQGVLLVDGRLHLGGPLLYAGLVIARGGIDTFTDGPTISGMVLSASGALAGQGVPPSVLLAHRITIRYSRCDVQHGIASTRQARPVRSRAWTETF